MHPIARLDLQHVWHPFTQMQDWLRQEPIVLVSGRGATVRDIHGRAYLDANSSIWTNLHGHRHPQLDGALRRQLRQVAHTSALGLANPPAAELAAALVKSARLAGTPRSERLNKVFFSDDGSTAIEVALKLAYTHALRSGQSAKPRFLGLRGAYHGDTVGATSLGQSELFHGAYKDLLFRKDTVMAPYCYRCPFNRAKPERADARDTRQCGWECVDQVARRFEQQKRRGSGYAALIYEPRIQGAAGMIPQPAGWLARVAALARDHGTQLIADEVLTGFGRTGVGPARSAARSPLYAGQIEGVTPDYLCLAKGLTGGYLPMAATLTTDTVFNSFLGDYSEFRTFFHGHSYTANPLGASVANASLALLRSADSFRARQSLERQLTEELKSLWALAPVGDIRQVGLVVGVELVRNRKTREAFPLADRAGIRVCAAMARRGVLTRPIGNVVPLLPPYCTTAAQLRKMVGALHDAIAETF